MAKRFLTIWFRYLKTDWLTRRQPALHKLPFVLAAPDHGRMVITATNRFAEAQGINTGMVVADARVIIPSLQVIDDKPSLSDKLLQALAEWFVRYSPVVSFDLPDGLILDVTGCAHLWGGEKLYLQNIVTRLKTLGYNVRAAIADTIGAAWAIAHYENNVEIIENGQQTAALFSLPPEALRLDSETVELLHKLGLNHIGSFIGMPRSALRRRFGQQLIQRIDQALAFEEEIIFPVQPVELYQERLPCLEPMTTAAAIEIALQRLLDALCQCLRKEQKGLRIAIFKCYRIDGKIEKIEIGTNRPTHNTNHLFKLFQIKIETIEPALGIELFTLEAQKVEDISPLQEKLWQRTAGLDDINLSELLDRFNNKFGPNHVHRYLPDEHYWPERSIKSAASLTETSTTIWKVERPRPLQLLPKPEPIEVTAPIPDYPPMLFRYKGKLHKIIKADGPERIEQEWWLQRGQHRDYYYVEDEEGHRYWLFRLGHYADRSYQWFIHGFFA
jgi:protein ImuB